MIVRKIILLSITQIVLTYVYAQDASYTNATIQNLTIAGGSNDYSGWGDNGATLVDQRPNSNIGSAYIINRHFGLTFSAHSYYGGIRFYNQSYPGGPFDVANGAKMVMSLTDGNVGINLTNPATKLHLHNGTFFVDNVSSNQIVLQNEGSYYGTVFTPGTGKWSLGYSSSRDTTGASVLTWNDAGNVGVGTADTKGYKFAVNGSAVFTKAVVKSYNNWPDYVFDSEYKLPSLNEVEEHIRRFKHLPNVPSAAEVEKEGIDLGSNQATLLRKIEELTLYAIEQNKEIQSLKEQNKAIKVMKDEIENLKRMVKEIEK